MKRGGPIARRTPLAQGSKPLARSALKATAMPKRRTPVPSRSARRPAGSRVPPDVVAEVKRRSGGWCERCTSLGRRTPGTELHHRLPRSRGGPDDVLNLADLCRDCHHDHAHGRNEHPWLIRGSIIRGVYTGPVDEYRLAYPAA